MTNWKVKEQGGDEREWGKETRADVEEALEEFSMMDLVVVSPTGQELSREEFLESGNTKESTQTPPEDLGSLEEGVDAEVINMTEEEVAKGYQDQNEEPEPMPDVQGTEDAIVALAENPIEWLESKNSEYVNTIKGKDAISKRGFRYIQFQFGVSTESELVETLEDPLGVIVWAKAEMPDGRTAEAHGEAYQFESGLDENEFVRYADTRAKNRALADLTASGALAAEEMKGHNK